jgi:hypothetical protein
VVDDSGLLLGLGTSALAVDPKINLSTTLFRLYPKSDDCILISFLDGVKQSAAHFGELIYN